MQQAPAHKVKLQSGSIGAVYSFLQPNELIDQEITVAISINNTHENVEKGIIEEVLESKNCDLEDMIPVLES